MQILLDDSTAAEQSAPFLLDSPDKLPVAIKAGVLIAGETVTLQYQNAEGDYVDYYEDGSLKQLSETNSILSVVQIGWYRINKTSTPAGVSVALSSVVNL